MKTALRLRIVAFVLAAINVSTATVQAQFLHTTNNGSITITRYTGSGGAIAVPETISGLAVTAIGDYAFPALNTLSSLAIPNSVTNIAYLAFYGCKNLSTIAVDALNGSYVGVDGVLLNKSQTTLIKCPDRRSGNYTVPDSVTQIQLAAFSGCFGLTNITMPDNLIFIGQYAFSGCTNLTNIRLPNTVTNIGGGAFLACRSLSSVKIPGSVIIIHHHAFSDCTSLTNATIGKSVIRIWSEAFSYCQSLKAVHFEGNAPEADGTVFVASSSVTIYYLPGTAGWGTAYAGRPTLPWVLPYPFILNLSPGSGIQTNEFGFTISWATNTPVVVEACPSLTNPTWSALSTNALTDGSFYFSDPEWTNYASRFYRIRSN